MAITFTNVTEGSGKKLAGWDHSEGGNTIIDEFTIPGEFPRPSYTIGAASISTATAASHLVQIMAGSSLNVRVRSLRLWQQAAATTVLNMELAVFRLTTAGTGGTSVTARPYNSADSAAGCTAMTLPSSKGTEGVALWGGALLMYQTIPVGGLSQTPQWEWRQGPGTPPIIIPAGTSNGICIKNGPAVAAGTVHIWVELVETSFV